PLLLAMRLPLQGHAQDLHPLEFAHAGRTKEASTVTYTVDASLLIIILIVLVLSRMKHVIFLVIFHLQLMTYHKMESFLLLLLPMSHILLGNIFEPLLT